MKRMKDGDHDIRRGILTANLTSGLRTLFAPVMIACLVSSCETVPSQPAPDVVDIPALPADEPGAGQVDPGKEIDPGFDPYGASDTWVDPLLLADDYLLQSRLATGAEAVLLKLSAAELYMQAGRTSIATDLTQELRSNNRRNQELYASENYRLDLLDATRRFRDGEYRTALRMLDRLPAGSDVDTASIARMLKIRAYAQAMVGDKAGAISTLARRTGYLTTPKAQIRNNNQIWAILQSIPDRNLELMSFGTESQDASPDLLSWIELATLIRSARPGSQESNLVLVEWVRSSSLAFMDRNWLSTLLPPEWDGNTPSRIALLLPISSRFADSAKTVQNGFDAADNLNTGPWRPQIVVYDTGEEPGREVISYQQAVTDGADFIVGPLGRTAAESVVASSVAILPTLMLGTAAGGGHSNVFQFDLDPDQEAVTAARRAFMEGHRVASILYPQSSWGERLANSFWGEWTELGGKVVSTLVYDNGQFDYSEEIQQLLGVTESVDRFRDIDRVLGQPTEFQPRRRQDVDVIFLAARPDQGRLLRPQLSFHQGHDLPVYSTSHIYGGSPDPVNDADLDGVRIGVMPVILEKAQLDATPGLTGGRHATYAELDDTGMRLFALGMDAYDLIPTLDRSEIQSTRHLQGETGELALEDNGRIIRQPEWVHFNDGVITPLPPHDMFPLKPAMD
jgi:outer membrane PBP1 activator LpoA protein